MAKSDLTSKLWLYFKRGFVSFLISLIVGVVLFVVMAALGITAMVNPVISIILYLALLPVMLIWSGFIMTWVVDHVN